MESGDPGGKYEEIDVYVANELPLSLLQFPLRPASRPYELDKATNVRLKPIAKRLEIDVLLDTRGSNYSTEQPDHKKITKLTLRSIVAESKTDYAIGTFANGKLILVPVDDCIQLRPRTTYLDVEKQKADDGSDHEDDMEQEGGRSDIMAVEVQVKKRETERQQQARLNSYAYLSEREEEEPWQELKLHLLDSPLAVSLNTKLSGAVSKGPEAVAAPLAPAAYLQAIVPPPAATSTAMDGLGASMPGNAEQERLTEELVLALPAALQLLFSKHSVCTMANVRSWLLEHTKEAGAAKEAAYLTDRALHEALVSSGNVVCIRRLYLLERVGNPQLDPLRVLVVDILKDRETFKRSEVLEAAAAKKLQVNDSLYNKVVKDICTSHGNSWHLKPGAD